MVEEKLNEANKNIKELINMCISLKAQKEHMYCPYGGCKWDEQVSCTKCKKDYWNNVKKEMIDEYTVV